MIFADRKSDEPLTIQITQPGEDHELKAIAYCSSVLDAFRPDERRRILNHLCERYPEEIIALSPHAHSYLNTEAQMKPYRGELGIMERLGQNAPLPSMNRIAKDRRDALTEIERLKRVVQYEIDTVEAAQSEIEILRPELSRWKQAYLRDTAKLWMIWTELMSRQKSVERNHLMESINFALIRASKIDSGGCIIWSEQIPFSTRGRKTCGPSPSYTLSTTATQCGKILEIC